MLSIAELQMGFANTQHELGQGTPAYNRFNAEIILMNNMIEEIQPISM